MFEIEEKQFKTKHDMIYSHYSIIYGDRKILEVQIPEPKTEFTKDIFLKYQGTVKDLIGKICSAVSENKQIEDFDYGKNCDDFIYSMSGPSVYILYEDGVGQFGYVNTGSSQTSEKFVRNFLSLLATGTQLFPWNECYMVEE